jgi:hypothetical protein
LGSHRRKGLLVGDLCPGGRCLEEAVANLERKPAPGSDGHTEQQISILIRTPQI